MADRATRFWQQFSRGEIAVAAFTLAYMAVWPVIALVAHNQEFVFYFVVMCLLIAAAVAFHLHVRLHPAALWGLSLWGLAHMAGGLAPIPASWPAAGETHVLYNWWLVPGLLKYDQLVHAYGFGLVTWICWQGLTRAYPPDDPPRPTLGLLTLCVAAGMGFGAMNETVEFIATLVLPGTNVGGYENTGWDLVANFVGCLIAAVLIRLLSHRPPRPED